MFCLRNKLGSMHAKPASSRNSRGGIIARIPDSIFKQPGQFRCRTVIAIVPHATSSSRREAPEAMMNLPPKEGVGNAGCPLHPRPRVHLVVVERTRVTTSTPESPDVPARNGFTTYVVLSPVTGLFCHRRSTDMVLSKPGWADLNLRELDTSVGVSGPHDFAVRWQHLSSACC
jgi:hypothetical protein